MKIKFLKKHVNKKKGSVHDFEVRLAKKLINDNIATEVRHSKKKHPEKECE